MKLNEVMNPTDSKTKRKRVGRGMASGTGKTAGRGHKGQKSRSGVSIKGFEGGQMPIHRRLPKRGFTNIFRVEYEVINVSDLQRFVDAKRLDAKKTINKKLLAEQGIIKSDNVLLKILAKGEIKTSLNIEADKASDAAVKAIEKAGGKIKIVEKKEAKTEETNTKKVAKKDSKESE